MSPFADRWALTADLDAIGGTIVNDELDRLAKQIKLADAKEGITRTAAQRRAVALVAMATRSSSAKGGVSKRKPLFTVQIGDGTVANLCELSDGTVLHPDQIRPWAATALLESVIFDGKFTVIATSKRRTFSGALRRAIEVRDRHCQHPSGCDVPAERCDANHITPAARGGPTCQFGGNIECEPHNRIAQLHDDETGPRPERFVTHLDYLRALIRWRNRHYYPDDAAA